MDKNLKIEVSNLHETRMTNYDVLVMLEELSTHLDGSGASRVYDLVGELTGNRMFSAVDHREEYMKNIENEWESLSTMVENIEKEGIEIEQEMNKMIERKREAPTLSEVQIHAIMNFWYAEHNINKRTLIQDAFSGSNVEDLERAFESLDYSIFGLVELLNEKERGEFIRYIMDNYAGCDLEEIRKFYLPQKEVTV